MVAVAQSLAVHLSADGSWQVVVFSAHFCGGWLFVGLLLSWCGFFLVFRGFLGGEAGKGVSFLLLIELS